MDNSMLLSERPEIRMKFSGKKFALVVALSLVSLSILLGVPGLMTRSSFAATATPSYQGSINWTFVQGNTPQSSFFQIKISASTSAASNLPNSIYVTFNEALNGSLVAKNGCVLVYPAGATQASCTVTAPYVGQGEYTFSATFSNIYGKIVATAVADPLIEPEWRSAK
jgi:hypothetical protein